MASISDLVQKSLLAGYLTIEAEEQLRKLLTTQYNDEDLNAFVSLQEAAMTGQVRQESRECLQRSSTRKRFAPNSPYYYASVEQR